MCFLAMLARTLFLAVPKRILSCGCVGNYTIYGNNCSNLIYKNTGFNTIFLGAGDATVALNAGKGFDTISNFQLGSSRFFVGGLSNDLSFADSYVFKY